MFQWFISKIRWKGDYELEAEETDIKDCADRIEVGDWGGDDPETKLEKCANEVKAKSDCGGSFFFRAVKGRCFCEKKGASCPRKKFVEFNEYKFLNA